MDVRSLFLACAALGTAPAFAAETADRVTTSAEGFARERPAAALRDPSSFEETTRTAAELIVKPRRPTARAFSSTASVAGGEVWFFDATTDLFHDYDRDGYSRYLRVRFDADTVWTSIRVYAEIYLSADGNAWELLHTTEDFEIFASAPDDDYEVETELLSGYSTGLYDVLVELYDADSSEFLAEYGPLQSSDFSLLPLEDSFRDGAPQPPPPPPPPPVIVDDGGSGAVGWLTLPALLALLLVRRRGDLY